MSTRRFLNDPKASGSTSWETPDFQSTFLLDIVVLHAEGPETSEWT